MATVLVIGGGIGGPVLAIHLKNKGFKPIIFEKVRELKDVGGTLMLAPNGYKALSMVGLDKRIQETSLPVQKQVTKYKHHTSFLVLIVFL
jgi:salicylate hydroxylase